MEDKELEQIKEYLRLKKIEEEDISNQIIDEVYNEIVKKDTE